MWLLPKSVADWLQLETLSPREHKIGRILFICFVSAFPMMILAFYGRCTGVHIPFEDGIAILQFILITLFSAMTLIAFFVYKPWGVKFIVSLVFVVSLFIWTISFFILVNIAAPNPV